MVYCTSFKCDPGFIDEAFTSLSKEIAARAGLKV
jgi:hypothetical protein